MGKPTTSITTIKTDPYQRVTDRILADLERGVTPWTRPWSAEALAGRVTRPLRATGEPYGGINVILLWMEAVAARLHVPQLDDLQTGPGDGRSGATRRDGRARGLLRHRHQVCRGGEQRHGHGRACSRARTAARFAS